MRNSISHFGIIITMLISPSLYNVNKNLILCGVYMLGLMIFGFIIGIFIMALDTEAARKKKDDMAQCNDIWRIPIALIAVLVAGTMGHGLGVASSSYATKYVEVRTVFSNFIANMLVVLSTICYFHRVFILPPLLFWPQLLALYLTNIILIFLCVFSIFL